MSQPETPQAAAGSAPPPPRSISPQAQAFLAAAAARPAPPPYPPPHETEAWLRQAALTDQGLLMMKMDAAAEGRFDAEALDMDGAAGFLAVPRDPAADARILYDIHGGALIAGGGEACRVMTLRSAALLEARTYGVDYRMPPQHPYPAGLDDCLTGYRYLLERYRPDQIVVSGASAGGNLAAALMLRVRQAGLPFPAALILISPEVDLTESGDSFAVNLPADVVLKRPLIEVNRLYANGCDLADPDLSPLFGDFAPGYPPTLLTAGTRDLFLSNAVRMHNALRRSGQKSELVIEEAMPHGGFFGAPEDALVNADIRNFADRAWAGKLR